MISFNFAEKGATYPGSLYIGGTMCTEPPKVAEVPSTNDT